MQNKRYFFFWKQGFPKGGGGGPTLGKNSQKIPLFFLDGVPYCLVLPVVDGNGVYALWTWSGIDRAEVISFLQPLQKWTSFVNWSSFTLVVFSVHQSGPIATLETGEALPASLRGCI